MPKRVEFVPNPWKEYMDGNVWEFEEKEFNALPRFTPMVDPHTHEYIGMRMYQWFRNGKVYIVFTADNVAPEQFEDREQ